MWTKYIMNKEQLILFGATFLLFILLQPDLFVKIPLKYNMYFVLFHCLVLTLFYLVTYNYIYNVQEYFTENENKLFEKKRQELKIVLQKQGIDDLDKINDEKIKQIMSNITKGMSDKEIENFQQFLISTDTQIQNTPNSIADHKELNRSKFKNFEERRYHLADIASAEQILLFDSFSVNQQDALGKLLENMNDTEVEKYLKLDIETLKKTINDVLEAL